MIRLTEMTCHQQSGMRLGMSFPARAIQKVVLPQLLADVFLKLIIAESIKMPKMCKYCIECSDKKSPGEQNCGFI